MDSNEALETAFPREAMNCKRDGIRAPAHR